MSQGWCAKGIEREKQRRIKRHGNTFKGVIARASSTYAEKAQALIEHKKLIHGFREGNFVNNGGVSIVGRDGTGIPSEGYDSEGFFVAVVYTAEEKAAKASKGAKGRSKSGDAKAHPKFKTVKEYAAAQPAAQTAKWSRRGGFAGR